MWVDYLSLPTVCLSSFFLEKTMRKNSSLSKFHFYLFRKCWHFNVIILYKCSTRSSLFSFSASPTDARREPVVIFIQSMTMLTAKYEATKWLHATNWDNSKVSLMKCYYRYNMGSYNISSKNYPPTFLLPIQTSRRGGVRQPARVEVQREQRALGLGV